jgi:hypothetical protein
MTGFGVVKKRIGYIIQSRPELARAKGVLFGPLKR